MVRLSKQKERRMKSPRKSKVPGVKTGTRKDNLPTGFKEHPNALEGELATIGFIPKIR